MLLIEKTALRNTHHRNSDPCQTRTFQWTVVVLKNYTQG